MCLTLVCQVSFGGADLLSQVYAVTLCVYLLVIFFVLRVPAFSGLGMYVFYLFFFVQLGVLLQGLYQPISRSVVYILLGYMVLSPFVVFLLRRPGKHKTLANTGNQPPSGVPALLFVIGLVSVFAFYAQVGTVPLLAPDAENFRIEALAGRASNVILASTCFSVAILLQPKASRRLLWLAIACPLLLGSGVRSQAMTMVLIVFVTYWVGRGKRFLLAGGVIGTILVVGYGLVGVARAGLDTWAWSSIYKPFLWRLYVNTSNLDAVVRLYPDTQFRYGGTFLDDLVVLLPGPQESSMMKLKYVLGMNFDGGSVTPSVFGEWYVNFGLVGSLVGPLLVLVLVGVLDRIHARHVDSRMYYLLGFALAGLATTSLVPILINSYIPVMAAYALVVVVNKSTLGRRSSPGRSVSRVRRVAPRWEPLPDPLFSWD
ncbi:MAG: oligosaccharide repeat unit polymerase [Propionibacteriaceae bacterium]|nr:oligosaccharide repeat unit polymerase [Propionibacteriaceae bacterium]